MKQAIKISVTEEPLHLQKFFEIRYRRYAQEMGAEPTNSSKLEKDVYDNGYCHYLIFLDGEEVIGGCRLIDRKKAGYLPLEEFIFPNINLPENCVEISRYTLEKSCGLTQKEKIELQLECNRFVVQLGQKLGFQSIYANIRAVCLRWQKRIDSDLEVKIVGKENHHPGAGLLIPVLLSIN